MMTLKYQQGFIFCEIWHNEELIRQRVKWVPYGLLPFKEQSDVAVSVNIVKLVDNLSGFEPLVGHPFEEILPKMLH
jgi:hypothetical protein